LGRKAEATEEKPASTARSMGYGPNVNVRITASSGSSNRLEALVINIGNVRGINI
jgi:hypothetical protein